MYCFCCFRNEHRADALYRKAMDNIANDHSAVQSFFSALVPTKTQILHTFVSSLLQQMPPVWAPATLQGYWGQLGINAPLTQYLEKEVAHLQDILKMATEHLELVCMPISVLMDRLPRVVPEWNPF